MIIVHHKLICSADFKPQMNEALPCDAALYSLVFHQSTFSILLFEPVIDVNCRSIPLHTILFAASIVTMALG